MSSALFDVSNEIVVITGASGQLGYEYSKTFLENGARVAGIDLSESKGIQQLKEKYPGYFHHESCDLTDKKQLEGVAQRIIDVFGTPTVLVNNAAIDSPPDAPIEETGPFEDYPEASWDKIMNVNAKGVFLACQVFGALMAVNNKGSIINVSSIYGVVSPDQSIYDYRRKRGETFYKPVAYSASKSTLANLTRYLSVYWAEKNVRVNTLIIAGVFNNQEQAFLDAYCARIPIGRMASKDEYNGTMLFLASPASKYMTGSQITVDGGWTAI